MVQANLQTLPDNHHHRPAAAHATSAGELASLRIAPVRHRIAASLYEVVTAFWVVWVSSSSADYLGQRPLLSQEERDRGRSR